MAPDEGGGAWHGERAPPVDPPADVGDEFPSAHEEGSRSVEAAVARAPAYLLLLPCFVLHVLVGSVLQTASLPLGLGFSELFFFALPPVALAIAVGLRPAPLLGLRLPAARAALPMLGVALSSFPFAGGLAALNKAGVDALSLALTGRTLEGFDQAELFDGASGAEVQLLVVAVVLLAPLGEELLFRGYLLRVLGARYGSSLGLVVTAALFAAIHVNPTIVLGLFGLGLVFGAVRQLTGSLWPSVALHALQNGTSVLLLLSGVASSPDEELGALPALGLVAAAAPFLWLSLRALARRQPRSESELRVESRRGSYVGLVALAAAAAVALAAWGAIDGAGLAGAWGKLARPSVSGEPSSR